MSDKSKLVASDAAVDATAAVILIAIFVTGAIVWLRGLN